MSDNNRAQELYNEIKEATRKKKDLNRVIQDAYKNNKEFQDLKDELDKLKARKKELETSTRQEYSSEFNDLDDLKIDIKDMRIVLSDLLWNEIMKNHPIEVVDEYKNKYVPNILVTLKKEE